MPGTDESKVDAGAGGGGRLGSQEGWPSDDWFEYSRAIAGAERGSGSVGESPATPVLSRSAGESPGPAGGMEDGCECGELAEREGAALDCGRDI